MKYNLIGQTARIISDNENYAEWNQRNLKIVYTSNSGNGYDNAVYPEMLCDFEDAETGESCPFALYEYEFKLI